MKLFFGLKSVVLQASSVFHSFSFDILNNETEVFTVRPLGNQLLEFGHSSHKRDNRLIDHVLPLGSSTAKSS